MPAVIHASPLVSVVIPTFNRESMLVAAIESCINQSYENIEVIVVDDGSTDSTSEMIKIRIAGAWGNRVRYVRQSNSGASTARNNGLSLARGKYVQFLDSDDLVLGQKIELQVAELEVNPGSPEMCSCIGRIVSLTDVGRIDRKIGIHCESPKDYMRKLISVIHGLSTAAPLWRRDFLITRPAWREDIGLGDDLEYYIRLLHDARKVCFVNQTLFLIREHDGPHLSDVGSSRSQIFSAFLTHDSVVKHIIEAGIWDKTVAQSVFRKSSTLYANFLSFGLRSDVKMFEKWMIDLQEQKGWNIRLLILISFRRVIGRKLLLGFFRYNLFIKKSLYRA